MLYYCGGSASFYSQKACVPQLMVFSLDFSGNVPKVHHPVSCVVDVGSWLYQDSRSKG